MRNSLTAIKSKRVETREWVAADLLPTAKLRPFSETARFGFKSPRCEERATPAGKSKFGPVRWRSVATNDPSHRFAITMVLICTALILAGLVLLGYWRRAAAPVEYPGLRYSPDADS